MIDYECSNAVQSIFVTGITIMGPKRDRVLYGNIDQYMSLSKDTIISTFVPTTTVHYSVTHPAHTIGIGHPLSNRRELSKLSKLPINASIMSRCCFGGSIRQLSGYR